MAGWRAVGIDVGGTKIRNVLVNESGAVLAEDMRWTPSRSGPRAVLEAAAEGALQVMDSAESDPLGDPGASGLASLRERIRVIGVGVPGVVDSVRGMGIRAGNLTGWRAVPVVRELEKRLRLPVRIVNDVRAAAWGEWTRVLAEARIYSDEPVASGSELSRSAGAARTAKGAARSADDAALDTAPSPFLYVNIGTGVAAVLIDEGKIFEGATNAAGELGHTILDPRADEVCPGCGQRGDVESLVAGPALRRAYERALREWNSGPPAGDVRDTHPSTIFRLAREGKQPAAAMTERYIQYLGIALANVIGLYNPRRLVLGGGLGSAPALPMNGVLEQVRKHAYTLSLEAVRLERARLGDASGAVGAALWAMEYDTERTVAR